MIVVPSWLRALWTTAAGGLLCSCGVAPWAFGDNAALDAARVKAGHTEPAFRWSAEPVSLTADGRGVLNVELSVPEGFKVHSRDIQLQVKDAHGLSFGQISLPTAEPMHNDEGIDVQYAGRVAISVPVTAVGVAPGLFPVSLEGEVQGCAARRCIGASLTGIEAMVHVLPAQGLADHVSP